VVDSTGTALMGELPDETLEVGCLEIPKLYANGDQPTEADFTVRKVGSQAGHRNLPCGARRNGPYPGRTAWNVHGGRGGRSGGICKNWLARAPGP